MMAMDDDGMARLRRSFYQAATEDTEPAVYHQQSQLHAQRAALLGMYASLPVVYSSYPLLPQSQTVLDVWQQPGALDPALEKFISLFENLLATPQPWYYAHATMLEAGKARTSGTLMRVVNTKRTSDGRLQVLVQGLGRLRLLNETRREPYPRVDAQLMVDAEALLREERALVERPLAEIAISEPLAAAELARLSLAGAVARERAWWAYDAAGFSDEGGGMPGELVPFDAAVGVEAPRVRAEERAAAAVEEASAAWSDAGAQAAAADDEYAHELKRSNRRAAGPVGVLVARPAAP